MQKSEVNKAAPILGMVAFFMTLPAIAETTSGIQQSVAPGLIEVTTDSAIILESDDAFSELSIANPKIADISTISGTSLYIFGKQPGRTTLMLIGDDGSVLSVLDIRVSPDVSELKRRLAEVLPGEEIEVLTANDGLVLSGVVSNRDKVTRAIELASHYAPGKISNLISVEEHEDHQPDLAGLQQELRTLLPDENIVASAVGEGVLLSGTVSSEAVMKSAVSLASLYAPGRAHSAMTVAEVVATVTVEPAEVEARLREILPGEAIRVHQLGEAIVLSGEVSSEDRVRQALQVAQLVAGDMEISNLITVQKGSSCKVRTRRGGELLETDIPCRVRAATDATGSSALSGTKKASPADLEQREDITESGHEMTSESPLAVAMSSRPRPRPFLA